MLFGQFLLRLERQEQLLGAFEFGAVEGLLLPFDFAEEIFLDAVGEVFGDLAFGAAEEEGADPGRESPAGEGVVFGIVEFGELGAVSEQAGHGEVHEAPQVQETVFDGGAGQHEAIARAERAGHPGGVHAAEHGAVERRRARHIGAGQLHVADLAVADGRCHGASLPVRAVVSTTTASPLAARRTPAPPWTLSKDGFGTGLRACAPCGLLKVLVGGVGAGRHVPLGDVERARRVAAKHAQREV